MTRIRFPIKKQTWQVVVLLLLLLLCACYLLFESTVLNAEFSLTGGGLESCDMKATPNAQVETGNLKNATTTATSKQRDTPASSSFQSLNIASDWNIKTRAYPKFEKLPCFQANGKDPKDYKPNKDDFGGDNYAKKNKNQTHGFLFVKPTKVGGSTVASVQLRIQLKRNCTLGSFRHSMGYKFANRARPSPNHATTSSKDSFLYSWLRDPTKRVISEFFHFFVSRRKIIPTDANFLAVIKRDEIKSKNHLLRKHVMREEAIGTNNNAVLLTDQEKRDFLQDYDFIGITERFDESVVAMQLLLGLDTSEVLYLKAKSSGGFDDGASKKAGGCTYIVPSFVSPGMKSYFESEKWQKRIRHDMGFYRAANASLDRTIDETIGRRVFEQALAKFRQAQKLVQDHCGPITKFPCSEGGQKRSEDDTDCLWGDSGCGIDCMDRVIRDARLEDLP